MAGFQTGSGDDDVIAGINVTPLVDITLVLLIIFMVTTSYIVKEQIKVDLPRAASGEAEVQSTLTFKITEDGEYFLDAKPATLAEIGRVVKSRAAADPKLRAIIAADKSVEYGRVVDLIDTIKQNGLEKFALNIEKKASVAAPAKVSP
jgi:biopolymer transport protein ExbD